MAVMIVMVVCCAACAVTAVWALMRARIAETRAEAELGAERQRLADMQQHYEAIRSQAEAQFRTLAQKVLEERSAKLKEEGGAQLHGIVDPLMKDLAAFREKLSASNVSAAALHAEMKERIENLLAQTGAVSAQANNLANAIRGDAQLAGAWGEIQLIKVLELSGLVENTDYTYQESFFDDASGRKSKRTDVVIKLPGERALVIDAKNTLDATVDWHAAADEDTRKQFCEKIVDSLRRHIDEIAAADYPSVVPGAFPLVLMYVPLEEVYLLALKTQITVSGARELLRDYARRKGVVLVNASSVVPVAKLVEMMWNAERSEKNRQEMARAANELLQRANDFMRDFLAVGDALEAAYAKFESARKGLVDERGSQSIAKAAAKLVKLGAEPKTRAGKPYQLVEPIAEG